MAPPVFYTYCAGKGRDGMIAESIQHTDRCLLWVDFLSWRLESLSR